MGDEGGGGGGGGKVPAPPGQGLHFRQGGVFQRLHLPVLLPIRLKFGRLRVLKEAKIVFVAELVCDDIFYI